MMRRDCRLKPTTFDGCSGDLIEHSRSIPEDNGAYGIGVFLAYQLNTPGLTEHKGGGGNSAHHQILTQARSHLQ
jgi:hypothetical protein